LKKGEPQLAVSEMPKEKRVRKVFIGWSQNADYKTTVSLYSLRAKKKLKRSQHGSRSTRICAPPLFTLNSAIPLDTGCSWYEDDVLDLQPIEVSARAFPGNGRVDFLSGSFE
jgi:hypothetical protein